MDFTADEYLRRDAERLREVLAGPPVTWLFLGDSITQAVLHTRGGRGFVEHFTERVRGELGRRGDAVINSGVSGSTAESALPEFHWRLGRFAPDVVFVMFGTNDAADGSTACARTATRSTRSCSGHGTWGPLWCFRRHRRCSRAASETPGRRALCRRGAPSRRRARGARRRPPGAVGRRRQSRRLVRRPDAPRGHRPRRARQDALPAVRIDDEASAINKLSVGLGPLASRRSAARQATRGAPAVAMVPLSMRRGSEVDALGRQPAPGCHGVAASGVDLEVQVRAVELPVLPL